MESSNSELKKKGTEEENIGRIRYDAESNYNTSAEATQVQAEM